MMVVMKRPGRKSLEMWLMLESTDQEKAVNRAGEFGDREENEKEALGQLLYGMLKESLFGIVAV